MKVLAFFGLLFAAAVQATSSTGQRLLVVTDDVEQDQTTYSKIIGDIKDRGFQIEYESPKSESLSLFHLGERAYDHVFLLPTKAKGLGPNLTPAILVDFINAQGNILLALTSTQPIPTSIVSFLLEFEIQVPSDRTGTVVDHFSYDSLSAADLHDVLVLPVQRSTREDVKDLFSPENSGASIAFPRGIAQLLGPGPMLTPLLRAPKTAYLYNPREQSDGMDSTEELFGAGEQLSLVSTMQARNSARLAVVGSAEMLSDAWVEAKVQKVGDSAAADDVANREFARHISGWTFQELGVLRVNSIEHFLNESGVNETNPTMYRVTNDVTYTISMSEYVWDKWTAFDLAPADALQLEVSMLSPFHRLSLVPVGGDGSSTTYGINFKLPDQHGIFNFKVSYKRPFLTNVEEKRTVSVRHMAHDEWPRSYVISGAWPWIAGVGATVCGFLAFCALWMYSSAAPSVGKEKKTK